MNVIDRINNVISGLTSLTASDFTSLYISELDQVGHRYGPDSVQVDLALSDVDHGLSFLLDNLQRYNRTDVNVIVVSDHGMLLSNASRVIRLDTIIDLKSVIVLGSSPVLHIWPQDDASLNAAMLSLSSSSVTGYSMYNRSTMPSRFHYTNSDRIAPIVLVADPVREILNLIADIVVIHFDVLC